MEACSFGIPVVATDVGGTKEIVKNGENGFLIPKDFSPEKLLDVLRNLARMEEAQYGKLCANARRIWMEKFDAEKNYRKFYGELSELSERSGV
jgi:glycosyltransferase involved in cell wall biosynthesis